MGNRQWLLATLFEDAAKNAQALGYDLEIDEFCTAENMDASFEQWHSVVQAHLKYARATVFHAPFAELHPCAIDPMARELTMKRFNQAADLACRYGIDRMVAHGGFIPNVYYPIWYETQSAAFWKEFLKTRPGEFQLMIENVLEDDPESMKRMVDAIDDPRAGICLDVGHAHVVSSVPIETWIKVLGTRIYHVHLHNNDGKRDSHSPLDQGNIDISRVLALLDIYAPKASITLECSAAGLVASRKD